MLSLIRKVNIVWAALSFTLILNYIRHKLHLSTLCSAGRKVIPPFVFVTGWAALTGWIIPHFCRWDLSQILRRLLTRSARLR